MRRSILPHTLPWFAVLAAAMPTGAYVVPGTFLRLLVGGVVLWTLVMFAIVRGSRRG